MGQTEPNQNEFSVAAGQFRPAAPRSRERDIPVWELLRPTINHDLPNMLVALQGLLQMLRSEESGRLSPSGKDYLKRLSAVAVKLYDTVTTLRQISKAGSSPAPAENINLTELLRELAAARQFSPRHQVEFHSALQVPLVNAPRNLLFQSLAEIANLLAIWSGQEEFHCVVTSRLVPGGTEIGLGARAGDGAASAPTASLAANLVPPSAAVSGERGLDYNFFGPESRLALVLVEEIVRNLHGRLDTRNDTGPWKWVCVTLEKAV